MKCTEVKNGTHIAENGLLKFGVFQCVRVMWYVVALGFDFVPESSVFFLLTEKPEHHKHQNVPLTQPTSFMSDSSNWFFTYVTEEFFEIVASGIVMGIQNGGVQVLLLMISLPVIQLQTKAIVLIG